MIYAILLQWWCTRIRRRTHITTRTTGRESWRHSPLTTIITSTAKCSYRWVLIGDAHYSRAVRIYDLIWTHRTFKMHSGRARVFIAPGRETHTCFLGALDRSSRFTDRGGEIYLGERDLSADPYVPRRGGRGRGGEGKVRKEKRTTERRAVAWNIQVIRRRWRSQWRRSRDLQLDGRECLMAYLYIQCDIYIFSFLTISYTSGRERQSVRLKHQVRGARATEESLLIYRSEPYDNVKV